MFNYKYLMIIFFAYTRLRQLGASRTSFYPSSHTRLRQLADFPSLIFRSSFGEKNFGF